MILPISFIEISIPEAEILLAGVQSSSSKFELYKDARIISNTEPKMIGPAAYITPQPSQGELHSDAILFFFKETTVIYAFFDWLNTNDIEETFNKYMNEHMGNTGSMLLLAPEV